MAPDALQQVCIVGCGRWLRADDQVGLRVVDELMGSAELSGARIESTESPAADIPNWLEGITLLILVDAARGSRSHPPGTFERIDYGKDGLRLRNRRASDTHGLSVDVALRLSESLAILPPNVWIYAIAVEDCECRKDLSPPVRKAIPNVCEAIQRDVQAWLSPMEQCHA